jgi:methionyl-tRNA synthetase
VHVHGFLRIEGEKMSKSRGTFISASTYLEHLDPQYLRYYYAAKLSDRSDDIDLVFEDFTNRVNAELVNKLANLYSRTLKLLGSKLGGRLGAIPQDAESLLLAATAAADPIAACYERRDLAGAVAQIGQLAEAGNLYLQQVEPWKLAATDPKAARQACTAAANLGLVLAVYLKPVLPGFVAKVERMLGVEPLTWEDIGTRLEDRPVGAFERLAERVRREQLDALVEASRRDFAS